MDSSALIPVMTAAVVISAIALVIQAGLLFGMFRATKEMRDRVVQLLPKVEGLVDASRIAVDEGRTAIAEIREKSNHLLETAQKQSNHLFASAQKQMGQLEELLSDASARTRRQLDHAEMVVQETLTRVDETVALVQRGILKPVRGITGMMAGVQAAFSFLMRGNRPSPDQATVDEEMFI